MGGVRKTLVAIHGLTFETVLRLFKWDSLANTYTNEWYFIIDRIIIQHKSKRV